jgi:hypothetical protein
MPPAFKELVRLGQSQWVGRGGNTMTVTVTEAEPNIFPSVDLVDAKRIGAEIDLVLVTRIEGPPVRVRVRLKQAIAQSLADKINAAN